MASRNEKMERAIELYIRGPTGMRGKWEECCKAVGLRKSAPTLDDGYVRQRIAELGGAVAADYAPEVTPPNPEVSKALAALASPDDPEEGKWEELWKLYTQVAQGTVVVSPQQRLVMKDLIDRHFGKAGEKQGGESGLRVVVLPALGSGAGTTICPECGHRLVSAG